MKHYAVFSDLIGLTMARVEQTEHYGNDAIEFTTVDGRGFRLTHHQSCCESVYIESITGDLRDLEGAEIVRAEEACNDDEDYEYGQWTFYKLATRKGYVDIRFYGSSNGYYSVGVSFDEVGV